MKSIIAVFIIFCSSSSYGCSLAAMVEAFPINTESKTILPNVPTFKVSKIQRGIQDNTSCSGLASLMLKPKKPLFKEQGYIFEVIKGQLNIFHHEGPIKTTAIHHSIAEKNKKAALDEFIFHFYESTQKPINVLLKITAVSKSGHKSSPQYLNIHHDGANQINEK